MSRACGSGRWQAMVRPKSNSSLLLTKLIDEHAEIMHGNIPIFRWMLVLQSIRGRGAYLVHPQVSAANPDMVLSQVTGSQGRVDEAKNMKRWAVPPHGSFRATSLLQHPLLTHNRSNTFLQSLYAYYNNYAFLRACRRTFSLCIRSRCSCSGD